MNHRPELPKSPWPGPKIWNLSDLDCRGCRDGDHDPGSVHVRRVTSPSWWKAKEWLDEHLQQWTVLDLIPIKPLSYSSDWLFEVRLTRRPVKAAGE